MQKQQAIYEYLSRTGVLESGDDNAIKAAKKIYWQQYRNAWKQQQRKKLKAYTVLLTNKEAKQIQIAAGKQQTSATKYITRTALAGKGTISKEAIGKIREVLYKHYEEIEAFMVENNIPEAIASTLLTKIATIEKEIMNRIQL